MTRNLFVFAIFSTFFAGCNAECSDCTSGNGGSDQDGDGSCDNCPSDSGDTATDAKGILLVEAMSRNGEPETVPIVIGSKIAGQTGVEIALDPDKYTFGLGDPENMVDGIPLFTTTSLTGDWAESTWIAPLTTVTVESDGVVELNDHGSTETLDDDARQLNYYAKSVGSVWTCVEDDGTPHPDELVYTNGSIVDFPGIGKMVLTGTEFVDLEFNGQYYSGEFDTPTTAWIVKDIEGDEYDASYFCWAGNENQDPRISD